MEIGSGQAQTLIPSALCSQDHSRFEGRSQLTSVKWLYIWLRGVETAGYSGTIKNSFSKDLSRKVHRS